MEPCKKYESAHEPRQGEEESTMGKPSEECKANDFNEEGCDNRRGTNFCCGDCRSQPLGFVNPHVPCKKDKQSGVSANPSSDDSKEDDGKEGRQSGLNAEFSSTTACKQGDMDEGLHGCKHGFISREETPELSMKKIYGREAEFVSKQLRSTDYHICKNDDKQQGVNANCSTHIKCRQKHGDPHDIHEDEDNDGDQDSIYNGFTKEVIPLHPLDNHDIHEDKDNDGDQDSIYNGFTKELIPLHPLDNLGGKKAEFVASLSIDELLRKWVGEFGRAQIVHFTLTSLAWALEALHTLVPIFADKAPAWRCSNVGGDGDSGHACSSSSALCAVPPALWEWVRKDESTVSQWNLVCHSSYMQGLAQSSFFIGCLVGAGLFGHLSDSRLGRRGALMLACISNAACGMLTAASPNYGMYAFMRVATGVCAGGLGLTSFVLGTELIGPSRRTSAAMSALYFYPLGMLLLAGLATSTAKYSWRILYVVTSVPSVLYCIFILPFLSESPRWYLVRGRTHDALEVLKSVARKNGTIMPEGIVLHVNEQIVVNIDEDDKNCGHHKYVASNVSGLTELELEQKPATSAQSISEWKQGMHEEIPRGMTVISDQPLQINPHQAQMDMAQRSKLLGSDGHIPDRTEVDERTKLVSDAKDAQCKAASGTLVDVFRSKDTRVRMVILVVVWFASALGYYSFNLNVGNLGTNLTLSVMLNALAEVPGYAITTSLLNRVGRRVTLIAALLLTACSSLVGATISHQLNFHHTSTSNQRVPSTSSTIYHHHQHSQLRNSIQVACNLIGLFSIAGTYNLLYLYTSELFPTVVRNAALGLANQAGAIGSIVAPIAVFSAHVNRTLPFFIIGAISLLSGIMAIKLPETMNHPFHDTLESMRRANAQAELNGTKH